MTDTEILIHAKSYIDKLAQGINPLTDQPVNETDIINNVRISRCLFYVSDILDNVIKGHYPKKNKSKRTEPFALTPDDIKKCQVSEIPISITAIAQNINAINDRTDMKRLKATSITQFLIEVGILYRDESNNRVLPTPNGVNIGIQIEHRYSQNGLPYMAVLYSRNAQKFIFDNLPKIIEINNREKFALPNSGSAWSENEELKLKEFCKQGLSVKDIAQQLQRTEGAIASRMEKLGIVINNY